MQWIYFFIYACAYSLNKEFRNKYNGDIVETTTIVGFNNKHRRALSSCTIYVSSYTYKNNKLPMLPLLISSGGGLRISANNKKKQTINLLISFH